MKARCHDNFDDDDGHAKAAEAVADVECGCYGGM